MPRRGRPDSLTDHARASPRHAVTLLFGAAGCLLSAQILGIYALRSRKADLIFSMLMVALVVASLALGYLGARQQLG